MVLLLPNTFDLLGVPICRLWTYIPERVVCTKFDIYVFMTKDRFYFWHLDNNIPTAPAYGVYIWQLVRYTWACGLYSDILQGHRLLGKYYKLLNQGFLKNSVIYFSQSCLEDSLNLLLKNILSLAYRWRKMVLFIWFWFKDDYWLSILSYNDLLYYLLFKW